jgi:hypothetical protein
MKSETNLRLEQLRAEAKIEILLREKKQDFQTWTELEKFTKRILRFELWDFQLEVRRWVTQ